MRQASTSRCNATSMRRRGRAGPDELEQGQTDPGHRVESLLLREYLGGFSQRLTRRPHHTWTDTNRSPIRGASYTTAQCFGVIVFTGTLNRRST